jgi:hypothetical protein
MNMLKINRKNYLPFPQNGVNRTMFRLINLYLIIGSGSLLITLFYLMGHLSISDKIIYYCIPGFVLGISSIIIYSIGYHSLHSAKQDEKRHYRVLRRYPKNNLFAN